MAQRGRHVAGTLFGRPGAGGGGAESFSRWKEKASFGLTGDWAASSEDGC